jgi:single-strand DNA-binding protein
MTPSLNKVMLIGHLGKDPELRYTGTGRAVATFSLATNESWKDQEGNAQERTEWHKIVAWGKLAEICGEWLKKGKQVYVEGRIQTRNYEDKEGIKRYITEVVVSDMLMLGSKGDGGGSGGGIVEAAETVAAPAESTATGTEKPDDLPF